MPFSCAIKRGGPGTTVELTAGVPPQIFRETLLNGVFEVMGLPSVAQQAGALPPLFRRPGSIALQR